VLNAHPQVAESAVFSKTDPNGVRRLLAFLVLKPSEGAVDLKLGEFCKEKKLGQKTPNAFIVTQSLPRNPGGKLQRKELPAIAEKIAKQQAKAKLLN
jgi:fatty-acyl-CoA synthase